MSVFQSAGFQAGKNETGGVRFNFLRSIKCCFGIVTLKLY
jgi:hypothetical protein